MIDRLFERRLRSLETPSHARVLAMAHKMKGVLNLGGGDPDFDTPKHIREAAVKALGEGWTHYPPPRGLPQLREAIAEYHGKYGVVWSPSEVLVTAGSGLALFVSMAGTINPGEEVIVLEPYFMAYSSIISYLGAEEVPVALEEGKGYRLNLEELEERVTPNTKMIVLCNPNNPSGTVYTEKELAGIADIAKENDLLVLSDEVYSEFVWDGRKHHSIAALPKMKERTIVTSSFSKTFAMTGWRLGYVIADEPITSRLARIPVGYRTNTFVQLAGIEALKGPWGPVEEMAKEFDRRRRYFVPRLNGIDGVRCNIIEGAFYLFPNIEALGRKSEEFCETLLKESKILMRPGTAFGVSGEYHMRIPLIKPIETLENVANAIEAQVEKTSN